MKRFFLGFFSAYVNMTEFASDLKMIFGNGYYVSDDGKYLNNQKFNKEITELYLMQGMELKALTLINIIEVNEDEYLEFISRNYE